MPKMMMGQIDHARARVRSIKATLIGKAPVNQKAYNTRDLVNGLRTGEVKFSGVQLQRFAQEWADQYSQETSSYSKPNFESIVLEYAFAKARTAEKTRYDAEFAAYSRLRDIVNEKANAVEDAIVLGDQHAALIALQEFAAFNPADFKEDTFNTL